MFRILSISALALMSLVSTARSQQTVESILQTVRAKQAERLATVDNYTVVVSVLGMNTTRYFEKMTDRDPPVFRLVPITEYQRRELEARGISSMSSQQLEQTADVYDQLGDRADQDVGGMPGAVMGNMFRDMATTYRIGATYEENDGSADAAAAAQQMDDFSRRARLVTTEAVDGRGAFLLRQDDVKSAEQPAGEFTFTLRSVSVWIDAAEYVPLKTIMDGELEAKDGTVKPMSIQRVDQDYRRVGTMYESYRQVLRLSGMTEAMDPKDRAEMEKAQAEMVKVKEQLAQMPEEQRKLIEGRMKSAMEQMERMAGGNAEDLFEMQIDVVSIAVNEGPPSMLGDMAVFGSDPQPAAGPEPDPSGDLGEARDDLDRFAGVYGVPDQTGARRDVFVAESCDGYLVAGGMSGDASNWWMTSVSDAVFEMSNSFMSLRLEFDVGPDGTARAMRHDLEGFPSPLPHVGPLPDEWSACVQREAG